MGLLYTGAGHVGLGEAVPPGFSFPTKADYTRLTAAGLQSVLSVPSSELAVMLTPPSHTSAVAMRTLIESATGTGLSSLLSVAIGGAIPDTVVSMMGNLLDGALDLLVEDVGASIGNALGAAGAVVPVIGQMVAGLIENLMPIWSGTAEEQRSEALEGSKLDAVQKFKVCCQSKYANMLGAACAPAPTGVDQLGGVVVTPADTFRPLAYSLQGKMVRPFYPSMCFVWLCGGETQGFSMTRQRYETILNAVRARTGDKTLGLPQDVQRRMWSLVKGICSAVQDPQSEAAIIGDQGRSLYPLLVDIAYQHWSWPGRKRPLPTHGHWTEELLRALAADQAESCSVMGHGTAGAYGASWPKSGSCAEVYDLVGQATGQGFLALLQKYQTALRNKFGLPDGTLSPYLTSGAAGVGVVKLGAVVVKKKKAEQAVAELTGSAAPSAIQKIALVAGGLGASYLGYRGLRLLRGRSARR